jgi:hypothetical protein
MRYLISIFFLLSIISCGHVETHKDYYKSEETRHIQHKEMMAAVAHAQAEIHKQTIEYAAAHPLVVITNKDGSSITVNQAVPQMNTTELERIPMSTAAVQPREAPGERFLMKLTDNAMMFGIGWLFGDMVKTGYENAGHNTTTTAGGSISTSNTNVGGDVSIPTTSTTTTETITGSAPVESWPVE